jgi:ABC-type transport system substrate-binding protein
VTAGLAVSLTLTVACSGGSDTGGPAGVTANRAAPVDEGTPTPGGTLRVALPAEIDGLNPAKNRWSLDGNMIASAIYDTLMTFDEERNLVPRLAESVTPNADGTVWTIRLRPGVRFHDGTPFDAAAVELNIETRRDDAITGGALRPIVDGPEGVVVVDPLTVEVRMETPWFGYDYTLAAQGGYMAAPAQLTSPDASALAIGTGPFRQERPWSPGQPVSVVRNEDYWGTKAYLDGIEFRAIVDPATRAATLRSGGVDLILTQQPEDIIDFRDGDGVEQVEDVAAEETFVMLQLGAPPFDNVHARRALAHATDVAAVNAAVGGGIQLPADQPYTEGERYFVADAGYPAYDPDQARAELARYTADTGEPTLRFTIKTGSSNTQQREAELLQAQWSEFGIEASIEPIEQAVFLTDMFFGDFQAAMFRNFAYVNPDSNYIFWHSSNAGGIGNGSINFGQIRSAELDRALDTARRSADESVREREFQAAVRAINAEVPYIWLYHNVWGLAAAPKVNGLSEPQRLGFARQDGKPWWPAIWMSP